MKLSTKSTYGLRAMLNIALAREGKTISISDIARREGISISYLEQLLNRLRHERLIESVRGAKGGYTLAKDPSQITVCDIVNTLEGGIYPVHCTSAWNGSKSACKRSSGCVPKIVWMKLANAITRCLESITLKELCDEARRLS